VVASEVPPVEWRRLRHRQGQIRDRGSQGWGRQGHLSAEPVSLMWGSATRRGGAFSVMCNVGGAPSVGRRPSPLCGGPHGGGMTSSRPVGWLTLGGARESCLDGGGVNGQILKFTPFETISLLRPV
jgi:hypothetical protein